MPSENDWEDEPAFVIHGILEKLQGGDMTDGDWETLVAQVAAISPERSRLHQAGARRESEFCDSERSKALKDLQAAIRNRDQVKALTEAELASMVWS